MKTARLLFAGLAVLTLVAAVGLYATTALASPQYAYAPQSPAWLKLHQDSQGAYYLTDGNGYTLYSFAKDTPGVSNCYGNCAQAWPPYLIAQGVQPQAGWNDHPLLGWIQRSDGRYQVTYNNVPLYYFAKDNNPYEISGNGYGAVWSIVPVNYTPPAPAAPPAYPPPQPYGNSY
jgi:predicted lipoprotein with Yx(FWY)xxD motif